MHSEYPEIPLAYINAKSSGTWPLWSSEMRGLVTERQQVRVSAIRGDSSDILGWLDERVEEICNLANLGAVA